MAGMSAEEIPALEDERKLLQDKYWRLYRFLDDEGKRLRAGLANIEEPMVRLNREIAKGEVKLEELKKKLWALEKAEKSVFDKYGYQELLRQTTLKISDREKDLAALKGQLLIYEQNRQGLAAERNALDGGQEYKDLLATGRRLEKLNGEISKLETTRAVRAMVAETARMSAKEREAPRIAKHAEGLPGRFRKRLISLAAVVAITVAAVVVPFVVSRIPSVFKAPVPAKVAVAPAVHQVLKGVEVPGVPKAPVQLPAKPQAPAPLAGAAQSYRVPDGKGFWTVAARVAKDNIPEFRHLALNEKRRVVAGIKDYMIGHPGKFGIAKDQIIPRPASEGGPWLVRGAALKVKWPDLASALKETLHSRILVDKLGLGHTSLSAADMKKSVTGLAARTRAMVGQQSYR